MPLKLHPRLPLLGAFILLQVGCSSSEDASDSAVAAANLSQACHSRKKPLVLVHGAFHGAWTWDKILESRVPAALDIRALTLPAMGEESANAAPNVSLETHIAYVSEYLESNDLRDVTLVVHSYGGIVGAGVLRDDVEARVSKYVCIDCVVPDASTEPLNFFGEVGFDPAVPPPPQHELCAEDWLLDPFIAPMFGVLEPALVDYVNKRLSCQPIGTFVEPLDGFTPIVYQNVQATYVYTDHRQSSNVGPWFAHDVFLKFRERSQRFGFAQLTLEGASHDCMITNVRATQKTLFKIALGR
jgi:pimeloyl-ACP methyl ester carboxylesterase